jgi:UDPglucose--hexose-1-phosphate uridylyltransferase
VRIAPKTHQAAFEASDGSAMRELAGLTQHVVRYLESMFVSCAYNYTIYTRPTGVAGENSFHWWMEIFPRLTKVAGFEWGSECYINPVTPELAAEHFRSMRG